MGRGSAGCSGRPAIGLQSAVESVGVGGIHRLQRTAHRVLVGHRRLWAPGDDDCDDDDQPAGHMALDHPARNKEGSDPMSDREVERIRCVIGTLQMLAEAKESQMRECFKTASYDVEFYEGDAASLRTAVQLVSSYLPPKDGVPAELRAILMEMIDNDGGKGSSRWDSLRAGNARDRLLDLLGVVISYDPLPTSPDVDEFPFG